MGKERKSYYTLIIQYETSHVILIKQAIALI